MRTSTAREIPVRLASLRERSLRAGSRAARKSAGVQDDAVTRLFGLVEETSGAEIAEAAAVLPIMFMIVIGIFWFGQAFSIYGTITRAAQDGARAGAVPNCSTCASNSPATNATNAVGAALVAANLNVSNARPPVPAVSVTACAGATIPACGANICVQWPIQLSNTTGGATGVCGISVSFQYPFRFWLPFTSLNKQQIWMTAAAQVRMESQ
jgi:Flp pilus assembly protein TadG